MDTKKRLNILMDTYDSKLELVVSSTTKSKDLLDKVVEILEIKESWFLGIVGRKSDGSELWLDEDKEVAQHRFRKGDIIHLQCRYKFFPCDVNKAIVTEPALKMLFTQVFDLILSGRVFCPKTTAIELASYAAQVKFGNLEAVSVDADYLKKDRWVPSSVLRDPKDKITARQVRLLIADLHKSHYGLSIGCSMRRYLEIAQSLSMYGLVHFEATVRRADTKIRCHVGVSPHDVRIFEDSNLRLPVSVYAWKNILSCTQLASKLRIKLRGDLSEPDFEISSKSAEQIFMYCVSYQRLFNKQNPQTGSSEVALPFPSGQSTDEVRLENALVRAKEDKEKADQEIARIKKHQATILERVKMLEQENEILRQKNTFLLEKIRLWKSQISTFSTPSELYSNGNIDSDGERKKKPVENAQISGVRKSRLPRLKFSA